MASLNFDESIVLILFAQAGLGARPSRAQLVQFDNDLQRTFGKKLNDILAAEGMDPDVHNRSVVLGCRPHMAGNIPDTQIRNACRFVLHTQQELGALAIAAFRASAAASAPVTGSVNEMTRATSARKSRRKKSRTRKTSRTRKKASAVRHRRTM